MTADLEKFVAFINGAPNREARDARKKAAYMYIYGAPSEID
jgi:hypothetical protein